jgi:hypothetical protein
MPQEENRMRTRALSAAIATLALVQFGNATLALAQQPCIGGT